ncbi:MAG: hypothetical protein NXI00_15135 [Cytophagales bacterium]|nr:hypothetical protein [Cytophagales bacterium]
MEKSYQNLGYVLLLLIPLTFLAFFKSYFGQFPNFTDNITPYIHLHAFIASVWILMLIIQPILILKKKNALHRQIGKASYVVFPLLILSFVPQILRILASDYSKFVFFPLSDSIALLLFYVLAIKHRRQMAKHMRYMIGTAIVFLGPTIGRIGPTFLGLSEKLTQNIQYSIIYLLLALLIFRDRRNNKNFRPYINILGVWILHMLIFNFLF